MSETWHGTGGGYTSHACRCDDCRSAWAEASLVMTMKRRMRWLGGATGAQSTARSEPREHGTLSTFNNWRCRCDACCAAMTAYNAKRWKTRKAKTAN